MRAVLVDAHCHIMPDRLALAIRRFFDEPTLAGRLRASAATSVGQYGAERVYAKLEAILAGAAR